MRYKQGIAGAPTIFKRNDGYVSYKPFKNNTMGPRVDGMRETGKPVQ